MSRSYRGKRFGRSAAVWAVAALVALAVIVTVTALNASRPAEPSVPAGNLKPAGGSGDVSGSAAPVQEPAASEPQTREDEPLPPAYDFSQPAPEREAVDNSYFDDAAFVGDSRTDGFMIYSGIGTGKNLTSNGLSIFKLGEKKALTIDGEKYTLLEALAMERYGKVYLSLGVNELGYQNDEGFYTSYCAAIDEIRLMRQAAEEKQVVFLDLYSEFVDENNELPAEASRDGVHLGKEYCQQWLAYLKTHTADFDALYPNGPPPVEEVPQTITADGSEQG